MTSIKKDIIIRVRYAVLENQQELGSPVADLQRICGYLNVADFCKLMNVAENKVNPRNARNNPVVRQIRETLEKSPELFWIMSRGLLISTRNCVRLDRGRVRLSFDDLEREGIMDGGHNALAIASFLLHNLMGVRYQEVNEWKDCKNYWAENHLAIEKALAHALNIDHRYDFLVPIEIVAPLNQSVPGVTEEDMARSEDFCESHMPDICAARNTNVQLTETAKSNQLGLYELLKEYVPDAAQIVWKAGDGKGIKCEDVVALACLPLSQLIKENGLAFSGESATLSPISIYSQKSKCVNFYKKVLTDKAVSTEERSKYIVTHSGVKSALTMVSDIMHFFDRLYILFPNMYNKASGRFGRLTSVQDDKSSPVHFKTTPLMCNYTYPDGFIYPLMCALISLMRFNHETGRLEWTRNPSDISDDELCSFGYQETYIEVIKALNYDPNKVGKSRLAYNTAEQMFRFFLNR